MKAVLFLLFFAPLLASAHNLSDAELRLSDANGQARLELSVRLQDLALALPLDQNGDRALLWGELESATPLIESYVQKHLSLHVDSQACALELTDLLIRDYQSTKAAWLALDSSCSWPATTATIDYRLLFEQDPSHRGIIINDIRGGESFVASPEASLWQWESGTSSKFQTVMSYVRSGVHHIWIGADHLLFIVVLILPAFLGRHSSQQPREVLKRLAGVVTAFTVAHSITLAFTTFGWIQPSMAWIELAIAASVAIAALNNLFEWVRQHNALIAFAFGLLHGFGFASVLAEFGLPAQNLGLALVGFNLGVELGQLLLVAICVPVLLLVARHLFLRRLVLQAGSAIAALIAFTWMFERAHLII